MELASSAVSAEKRVRGRQGHLWGALRRTAPSRRANPTSALGRAATQLYPWHVIEYPGLLAGMVRVLQSRASPHTIRDWIRGKRRAPQWAVALLSAALDRRIAELQHAKAILEKEKPRS